GGALGNWGCRLVGINLPCSVGYRILGSDGGVIQRSWDNIPVRYNGQTVWAWFTATADGYSGYIPTNANYIGGGRIQPVGYGGPPRFSPSRGNSPPDTNIGQLNGVTDLSERDLLQNAPQPPNTDLSENRRKVGECNTLRIGISRNNNLTDSQFAEMQDEISRIYSQIGIDIDFVSDGADYWLSINNSGSQYSQNPTAAGITYLGENSTVVTNQGRVFVDRLTQGAKSDSTSRTLFDRVARYSPLAVGLGRAGSHEIGHYLLQQLDDSANYSGPMRSRFSGVEWFGITTQNIWTFDATQGGLIRAMVRDLRDCNTRPTNRHREPDY
ncbi:MAG: hypothetical protein ACRD6X_17540, partial [Pyrinomonadaceae bacterium]